jgi:hypothetical protein
MSGSGLHFDTPPALRALLAMFLVFAFGSCASLPNRDPLQVTVADIESLPGEGMEMRMMVKLRVQNPNDAAVEYDGIYLKLEVLDKTFATGVSDERGSVPRYGESLINVPMTVSTLRIVANALGIFGGGAVDKVHYKLHGKLDGPVFGSTRFELQGDFAAPMAAAPRINP